MTVAAAQQPWPKERLALLIELCRAGEPWRIVARQLRVSRETATARWLENSTEADREERKRKVLRNPGWRPGGPAWREVTPRQIAPIPADLQFFDDPAARRDHGSAGRPAAPDRASWCGCAAAMTARE